MAIFTIAMLIGGIKIIDQTEVGVIKTFGRVDHTISGGLNFVNPISDTVEIMDLRVHVRESSFASYTKDAQPVTASIEYQYEMLPASAMDVVKQFGSYEILETKLNASVEERAKIVFARYSAMPLLEARSTLSAQVDEEVKLLEDTFPVHFTNVVVKDIDFSDAFEAAVEAKMQAEQNALRMRRKRPSLVLNRRVRLPQSTPRPLLPPLRVKPGLWKLPVRLWRICLTHGLPSSIWRSGTASCPRLLLEMALV